MGTLVIHSGHQKNPMVACITEVFKEFNDIPCDFMCGPHIAVLYISLRFHRLQPQYFRTRIDALDAVSTQWRTKIVLCVVDVENVEDLLHEVQLLVYHKRWALYLTGSERGAARYLETLVTYQNKSADIIRGRLEADKKARVIDVLISSGINKTDANALLGNFGSLQKIMAATKEELKRVPGIGTTKVDFFWNTFHHDFDTLT